MLVGTLIYDFTPTGLHRYNAAVLVPTDGSPLQYYEKQSLVAFGEYVPLFKQFPVLLKLTPFHDEYVPRLAAGRESKIMEFKGLRFAPLICFEDTIPDLARRCFWAKSSGKSGTDAPKTWSQSPFSEHVQPQVLINLTNDGVVPRIAGAPSSFGGDAFRCVECRVPMARAVNTGISALIDGNGEIRDTLAKATKGVLVVQVPLDSRTSLYRSGGDWFPMTCAAITIGLIPLSFLRRKGRP